MDQHEAFNRTFDRLFPSTPELPEETRTEDQIVDAVCDEIEKHAYWPEELFTGSDVPGERENSFRRLRVLIVNALQQKTAVGYEALGKHVAELALTSFREEV